jgi:hypothetical protein
MRDDDEVEITGMSGSPSVPLEQSSRGSAKLWLGLGIATAVLAPGWLILLDKLGILGLAPLLVFGIWILPTLTYSLGILFGYLASRRGRKIGGIYTICLNGAFMVFWILLQINNTLLA